MLLKEFKIRDKVKGKHKQESYEGIIVQIDSNCVFINYPNKSNFRCKVRENGHVAAADGLDNGHDLELIKPLTAKELNKQNICQ